MRLDSQVLEPLWEETEKKASRTVDIPHVVLFKNQITWTMENVLMSNYYMSDHTPVGGEWGFP